VSLNLRGVVSRVFKKNNFTDITDPTFQDRILSELGDPKWQGQFSTNLTVGMFTFGHRIRYVDKMTVALAYETQHEFQGRPPTNADAFPRIWYPRLWFNDFRIDVKPTRKYGFYVGVDNAFDRLPPLDLLGTESGATDPVGRFFYAGAKVDF
jgi:outer membrane receptor protein involved in Fe transport